MFLTERELRDAFWKNYNYNHRALRFQFESDVREGSVDLITVERYQDKYQVNAFEFKLSDVKKAILQARANTEFVHKSWIVMPSEKRDLILGKYGATIKDAGVGVILVDGGGHWEMALKPYIKDKVMINQVVMHLMMAGDRS